MGGLPQDDSPLARSIDQTVCQRLRTLERSALSTRRQSRGAASTTSCTVASDTSITPRLHPLGHAPTRFLGGYTPPPDCGQVQRQVIAAEPFLNYGPELDATGVRRLCRSDGKRQTDHNGARRSFHGPRTL